MRVISGTAKGRKLILPPRDTTRPLTDRAKEGLFNSLGSLGLVVGSTIADVYAGSGSFGIECLSRGAESVTFVEKDRKVADTIKQNLATFDLSEPATVVVGSAHSFIAKPKQFDLMFCDPPYASDPWQDIFEHAQCEYLVGHAESDIELPKDWEEVKRKKYGRAHIFIAQKQPSKS